MKITLRVIKIFSLVLLSCGYPDEYTPLVELVSSNMRGMEIVLPASGLIEGSSTRATALVILSSGKKREVEGISWESLDPDILEVDQTGLVSGLAPGRGRVSASLRDMRAVEEVNVLRRIDYSRIRISEVFYDAEGADDGKEFIELYNGNEYDADISGMMVTDGSTSSRPYVFPVGSVIGAKGYSTVAQSMEGFYLFFGVYPDYDAFTCTLNNSGETVLLMKPCGEVIDVVYIKGGTEDFRPGESWCPGLLPAAASGSSVNRVGAEDTDTCSDWESRSPSPGE
ncbi:MAG: lamin tail domain-containing protein [Spirochaetes bacterium]|nr:lamin tail domain-containing protein [Spirochaetota bacterium]